MEIQQGGNNSQCNESFLTGLWEICIIDKMVAMFSPNVLFSSPDFGEEVLYQDLSKDVERRLPSESVTWQRYGGFLLYD